MKIQLILLGILAHFHTTGATWAETGGRVESHPQIEIVQEHELVPQDQDFPLHPAILQNNPANWLQVLPQNEEYELEPEDYAVHLHNAILQNNLASHSILLLSNPAPNNYDLRARIGQDNALTLAAQQEDPQILKILLAEVKRRGLPIDSFRNSSGQTPLQVAAAKGNVSALGPLVKAGSEIDIQSSLGQSPLFQAAISGHHDTVKELLRLGADAFKKASGDYPLHFAASAGRTRVVETLVLHMNRSIPFSTILNRNGRRVVNHKNELGLTPLGEARRNDMDETAQRLIDLGAEDPACPRTGLLESLTQSFEIIQSLSLW